MLKTFICISVDFEQANRLLAVSHPETFMEYPKSEDYLGDYPDASAQLVFKVWSDITCNIHKDGGNNGEDCPF